MSSFDIATITKVTMIVTRAAESISILFLMITITGYGSGVGLNDRAAHLIVPPL
jgi:hypothetical protein